jgi:hypothetical protein
MSETMGVPSRGDGTCYTCGTKLVLGQIWRAGKGSSVNVTYHAGAMSTTVMGGGAGGTWPPPEPGESHEFCSPAHMHQWVNQDSLPAN